MDIALILKAIIAGQEYVILAIAIISMLNGSAKGAIATVSEIGQAGVNMTDAEALQKASDIMGRYLPFIPDFVRKWIIQTSFTNMKKAIAKQKQ